MKRREAQGKYSNSQELKTSITPEDAYDPTTEDTGKDVIVTLIVNQGRKRVVTNP